MKITIYIDKSLFIYFYRASYKLLFDLIYNVIEKYCYDKKIDNKVLCYLNCYYGRV